MTDLYKSSQDSTAQSQPLNQAPMGYYPYPPQNYAPEDDEIDLAELWAAIYKRKWLIMGMSLGLALLVAIYSLTIPNQYKADVLLAPVSSGGKSANLGGLGGLASLAGISLPGGGGGTAEEAMALLQSKKFLFERPDYQQIKQTLYAENYDAEHQAWLVEESLMGDFKEWIKSIIASDTEEAPPNLTGEILAPGEPSRGEVYKVWSSLLSVSTDKTSGLVTLSIEWTDPAVVAQWANDMVKRINDQMRNQAIENSEKAIKYLQLQVEQTPYVELRSTLYNLIEEHTKSLTLAKTQQEYAFKVIDPAVVPEEKSKPKRSLMVAVGLVLGMMLGIFIALIQNWRENSTTAMTNKQNSK